MAQKKFDPSPVHTHTFPLDELSTALRYARERIEGAIEGRDQAVDNQRTESKTDSRGGRRALTVRHTF